MKSNIIPYLSRQLLTGMVIGLCLVTLSGCTQKVAFLNSTVTPAAQGIATIKKDKNNNYAIQLKISNLAEVYKLQPPNQTYVVWILTTDGNNVNIGQINSSRKLEVNFETVSSYKPSKIFITAEDNGNAQYPAYLTILTTDSF